MILVDPPRWPAHGTLFSHLVSDTSLDELHAFAAAIGVHPRAFDHDHYDLREALHPVAVAAGATPVSGTELVRRLVASGLRVRGADRAPKPSSVLPRLRTAWESAGLDAAIGEELLARWSEPHRHYHDVRHLAHLVDALDTLGSTERTVRLAGWCHDAVYEGLPTDEERSAGLAVELLTGQMPDAEVAEVARLVRLTAAHDPEPGDPAGAALCDADLAILAAPAARYDVYVRDVRADYEHLPDAAWRVGRTAVLDALLAKPHLYTTAYGREHWEAPARTNLARERRRWVSSAG